MIAGAVCMCVGRSEEEMEGEEMAGEATEWERRQRYSICRYSIWGCIDISAIGSLH